QLEIPNEDEFIQMSLLLFYDAAEIGTIEPFNSWSVESENLSDWKVLIKKSVGYLKSKNIEPQRFEIESGVT
ncbi:MAG: hypothetical protein AB8G22_18370, partial [Saprospiraceae bacterium]